MYKLIVLSAVIAVAAGVAIGHVHVPAVVGVSNLAVAPATVVATPEAAVGAAVTNQVLGGVTGLTGVSGVSVVNPVHHVVYAAPLGLSYGYGYGW